MSVIGLPFSFHRYPFLTHTVSGRGVQEWRSVNRRVRLSDVRIIDVLLYNEMYSKYKVSSVFSF